MQFGKLERKAEPATRRSECGNLEVREESASCFAVALAITKRKCHEAKILRLSLGASSISEHHQI